MIKPDPDGALVRNRIQERLTALGKNQRAAALEAGMSASGIRNILTGLSRGPRSENLIALARVLETTPEYLMGADRPADPAAPPTGLRATPEFFDNRNPIPLYTSVEGGEEGALIIDPSPIDWLPRPHILDNIEQAYAILVTGDSMVPAYRPGERAWVNPRVPILRGEDHIFRAEDDRHGEWRALIKELKTWDKATWTVVQHNPSRTFQLERNAWQQCHRVVGKFARP